MAKDEQKAEIILDEVETTLKRLLLDVADFVEKNPLPEEAETSKVLLPDELKSAPLELRFAGGWVRDKLLGSKSHDIDVAINKMTGEQFGDRLKEYLDAPGNAEKYGLGGVKKKAGSLTKIEKNPEASKNLETVTTKILGLDIDLVNLRKETYTETSRNPQVEFGTPEEDALRRDATINALFYNVTTDQLEDFTKFGLSDMKNGVIRTPLEAYTTFKDDPLRVLRLIRFSSRLDFQIAQETKEFMNNDDIRQFFLAKITKERVWIEFEKMLKGRDPAMALAIIHELDLYRTIFLDPARSDLYKTDTAEWPKVYNTWDSMLASDLADRSTAELVSTLITSKEDNFVSWFLASMVPWADAPEVEPLKSGKMPPPLATQVAMAAFKPPNQVLNVLTASLASMNEIRDLKERKEKARDTLGMAIRKWGATWRLQVIFSMFYEIFSTGSYRETKDIISQYATFVSTVKSLNILEARTFKPLIDGTSLAKALETKPGPWMKPALDIVMAWQLRNPDVTDPAAAIEEVKISDVMSTQPAEKGTKEANGHVRKKQKKGELTSTLVSHILGETLKPLFSKATANPEITSTGRRRIGQTGNRGEGMEFGEQKPWKSSPYALDLLAWCCKSMDGKSLEREWGFVIPPLLAVLDDTDTEVRARGCRMLTGMLGSCPPALLKRTGLGPLFEESLYASVTYLPELTPEAESIVLLDAAIPALLDLVDVMHPAPIDEKDIPSRDRQKSLDTVLRKAILAPYAHAGTHVRIAEVLMNHLPSVTNRMGIDSVKHLKDITPMLSNILAEPLGLAYPPLLIAAARAVQAAVLAGWPRIWEWRGEVLRGLCVCWVRMEEESSQGKETDELRRGVKESIDVLRDAVAAHEEEWEAEVRKLVKADARLKDLLISQDT